MPTWWISYKGSGLEEALKRAYSPNAITQMMSGKAISRALCGHFLVEAALVSMWITALLPCELFNSEANYSLT